MVWLTLAGSNAFIYLIFNKYALSPKLLDVSFDSRSFQEHQNASEKYVAVGEESESEGRTIGRQPNSAYQCEYNCGDQCCL